MQSDDVTGGGGLSLPGQIIGRCPRKLRALAALITRKRETSIYFKVRLG